jgi:hypothetical protein
VNLSATAKRFLHKVDMFDDPGIDGRHFSGMMAAENVVEVVQCGKIILSAIVAVAHA